MLSDGGRLRQSGPATRGFDRVAPNRVELVSRPRGDSGSAVAPLDKVSHKKRGANFFIKRNASGALVRVRLDHPNSAHLFRCMRFVRENGCTVGHVQGFDRFKMLSRALRLGSNDVQPDASSVDHTLMRPTVRPDCAICAAAHYVRSIEHGACQLPSRGARRFRRW